MSDDDFRASRALAPIPPPSVATGFAPVPPVTEQTRARTRIPEVPTAFPGRPLEVVPGSQTTPNDRWAYNYTGKAGVRVDLEVPLKPAVELPEMRPLAVMLSSNPTKTQPPQPPAESDEWGYTYDGSSTDEGGQALGTLRFNTAPQVDATILYVAIPEADGNVGDFLIAHAQVELLIEYESTVLRFAVVDFAENDDEGVRVLTLTVEPGAHTIGGADGVLENAQGFTLRLSGLRIPNAAVRALVRYTAGNRDVEFVCDWTGGFLVYARRLELTRVTYAPDPTFFYEDGAIEIGAVVIADAPRPPGTPRLTILPADVEPNASLSLAVPPFAARVNLLARYGNEGAPGDAPLGQIFLAWVTLQGHSIGYIDAMSAREALFGAGLPVPYGVATLVLTNLSADPSLQLGAIWQLSV